MEGTYFFWSAKSVYFKYIWSLVRADFVGAFFIGELKTFSKYVFGFVLKLLTMCIIDFIFKFLVCIHQF